MRPSTISRRQFGTLACGCLAAATLGTAQARVPKTALGPDAALAKLKEGNAIFVRGGACAPAGGARIAPLAAGQAPFAIIVGCSDSRVPPEHVFDAGLGELFTVRVAGNTVDRSALGSVEYAVAALGVPLVVVLGHGGCGAVEAAVKIGMQNASYPGAIGEMVKPIVPAVLKAKAAGGDLMANAIRANVVETVEHLRRSGTTLGEPLRAGRIRIAGGVYDLATGAVDFVA